MIQILASRKKGKNISTKNIIPTQYPFAEILLDLDKAHEIFLLDSSQKSLSITAIKDTHQNMDLNTVRHHIM